MLRIYLLNFPFLKPSLKKKKDLKEARPYGGCWPAQPLPGLQAELCRPGRSIAGLLMAKY